MVLPLLAKAKTDFSLSNVDNKVLCARSCETSVEKVFDAMCWLCHAKQIAYVATKWSTICKATTFTASSITVLKFLSWGDQAFVLINFRETESHSLCSNLGVIVCSVLWWVILVAVLRYNKCKERNCYPFVTQNLMYLGNIASKNRLIRKAHKSLYYLHSFEFCEPNHPVV